MKFLQPTVMGKFITALFPCTIREWNGIPSSMSQKHREVPRGGYLGSMLQSPQKAIMFYRF